jgi:hypothetical protein
VVMMVESLISISALVLVFVVLPLLYAVDTSDGDDWVRHPKLKE